MNQKLFFLLLFCLAFLVGACASPAVPVTTTVAATSAPTDEPTMFVSPTSTKRIVQSTRTSVQMEPTEVVVPTVTPLPSATPEPPTATPRRIAAVGDSADLQITSQTASTYIDPETRLAFPLLQDWIATRHNEQTIILNRDNYFIDIYVTEGMSNTLPTIPVDADLVILEPIYRRTVGEIGRSALIKDGKRVNYFYANGTQPLELDGLAFYAVVYANDGAVDLPNDVIIESAEMIGGIWVVGRYSAEQIPIPTLDTSEIYFSKTFTATNGAWVAHTYSFAPFLEGEGENMREQHRQLFTVGRIDGERVWQVVDELEGWGLGVGYYAPLLWREDKLFFTYVPVPDGCGAGANGTDVWALDLESGAVEQILPYVGITLALNPTGSQIAVPTSSGFTLYDLTSGSKTEYDINSGSFRTSLLTWSPNGEHLAIVTQDAPCSEEPKRLYRIDMTSESVTLLNDMVEMYTLNDPVWLDDNRFVVYDFWGERFGSYIFDVETGTVDPAE